MTATLHGVGLHRSGESLTNPSESFGTPVAEDIYEALREAVRALGGAKAVGHRLRPEKAINGVERWLLDCLNPDRAEKLDPEQVVLIARWSCEVGHHGLIAFMCGSAGYTQPQPRAFADQLVQAQQRAIAAQRKAAEAAADLQTLIDNPRLLAAMKAAGLNVGALGA